MLKTKAQHLTELALCVAVVSAVFLSMQLYVQRSLQAKYKSGSDYLFHDIGQAPSQYEPYYATSNMAQRHGVGTAIPMSWGREARISRIDGHTYAVGPDIDSKDWDETLNRPAEERTGAKHIDAVAGRSGWQRVGPTQDAD